MYCVFMSIISPIKSPNTQPFSPCPSWKWRLLAPPHSWHPHSLRLCARLHQSHQENPAALSHEDCRPGGLCVVESACGLWRAGRGRRLLIHGHLRQVWPLQPVPALHPDGWFEPEPRGESREALVVELLCFAWSTFPHLAAEAILEL